jgi:hypothetical protein
MKVKTCEGRKLGVQDCWPVKGDLDQPIYLDARTQVLIVPGNSTQGYLLTGKRINNLKAKRFGLPGQITRDFYVKEANCDEENIKNICCDSNPDVAVKQIIDIRMDKKEYVSPLHNVTDKIEMMKDLEEILKIQSIEVFLEHTAAADNFQKTRKRKSVIALDVWQPGLLRVLGITFSVWEKELKNKEKKMVLIVERYANQSFHEITEEFARNEFEKLKNALTGLYYPEKVRDVLGDFEL